MIKLKRKQLKGFRAIIGDLEVSNLEGTIIAAFFPESREMTIKEIQERINYSYERVNSSLKSLTQKKIVFEEQKGKTLIYSLDINSSYSYSLGFIRYMLQRKIDFIKKHKIIYKALQEIEHNPVIWNTILFGSYSKGTETKHSDVDIIITCIQNKQKEIEHFVRSLKHKYGINFSPVVMPIQEFPNIKKENPELWHDLKMYGIALKGEDSFYFWMYKDEKQN